MRPVIRTQVQLTEEQAHRLKSIAHREGVSVAQVIRTCIDARLGEDAELARRYERAGAFVGVRDPEDAPPDLGGNHDRYLDDDFVGPR
jgi:hypothetical protein